ncbi:MAG: sulfite exporter TauE/SafE family protein [Pseudomonadales bacterium]|jgi:sulfite exporter TauE/SafE|nr:sulfite exporter TauE/SafE family protein [Pseudomonadales bacterium]MDP7594832.1 sulfite exporter TauE/SafE family protein [Pseudomonadales bacterium]HJN51794.1 sulfite exporter TauE/SafE family protein [Pseudomonadales bacterium]|tara:strand:- start:902 stop:1615 length:714 start_codon:yes stop_codon:yes gene_type:complete
MSYELSSLLAAAATIALIHTVSGPDHYLPFIVLSKSGNWSLRKTALITFLCSIGHILSSVTVGLIGVAFGIALTELEAFESFQGNIAAWALIAFGLVYFVWGVRQAVRNKTHQHSHFHRKEMHHEHQHAHNKGHIHPHVQQEDKNVTPWVLFAIFVFGPCEPLIPLLMYPAAQGSFWSLALVTITFGVVTTVTMLSIVLISSFGISFMPVSRMERYTHALGGATIFLCGMSIQFLGL